MRDNSVDGERFRQRIDDSVLVLFSMVSEAVGWATEALLGQDTNRARCVINDDRTVDVRCDELTGLIKERLAAAPLPVDELEDLVVVLQIVPELERSADLAEHIAQRALRSVGGVITPRSRGLIERMGAVVSSMWYATSTAYRLRSQDASFRLDDADNELDQLATNLIDEVVASNSSPQVAVDLGLIARFYERLGDHAVNLSRRAELMSALAVASTIHRDQCISK